MQYPTEVLNHLDSNPGGGGRYFLVIETLRNDDGDIEENVSLEMNNYFLYEYRSTLDVLSVSIALKTSSQRRRKANVQFQKEI